MIFYHKNKWNAPKYVEVEQFIDKKTGKTEYEAIPESAATRPKIDTTTKPSQKSTSSSMNLEGFSILDVK
jgi:hypothetical protein